MVDTTKILEELLGGGQSRGRGTLSTEAGAKMLEDLLGVGSGAPQGGGAAGRDNPFGGGQQAPGSSGGGLGDLLGKAIKEMKKPSAGGSVAGGNPFEVPQQKQPTNQDAQSEVFLRAMIQAGLSDGRIDKQEQQAIIEKIGHIGAAEKQFIQAEMAKGCDVNAFIHTVPRGIEEEVYAASLMAIQLDNRTEAAYLDALAKGLRITKEQSNAIHDRFGAQRLYS